MITGQSLKRLSGFHMLTSQEKAEYERESQIILIP